MTKIRILLCALSLFVAVFGAGATVSAQSAQEQFGQAQKLFDEKKFGDALPLFQKLADESKSPNARLYVARCLRELGRLTEAHEAMSATLQDATVRAEKEAKYQGTRDAAAAELVLLDRKVGKIIIALPSADSNATVKLEGTALPPDRVGAPIAVDPGTVTVSATSPDGRSAQQSITMAAGETKTIALTLSAGGTSPGPVAPPAEDQPTSSGGTVRTLGFVTAGIGVAGMVVFGVAAASAESKYATLEEECGGKRCTDPKYGDVVDSGKTMDTLSNVGLIVGIAGIGAGTAMIILGGPTKNTTSRIEVGPTSATLKLRGRF